MKVWLFLLVSVSCVAWAKSYPESKVKQFIAKKKLCYLAIGTLYDVPAKGERELTDQVLCISETTAGEGTINEVIGCGLVIYDMEKDILKSPHFTGGNGEDPAKTKGYSVPIVPKVDCNAGGFEKLLKVYPGLLYGATVEEALTRGMDGGAEVVLVYASDPKYEKWWREAKDKHAKATAAVHKARPLEEIEVQIENAINQVCFDKSQSDENDPPARRKHWQNEIRQHEQQKQKLLDEYQKRGGQKSFTRKCPGG